MVNTLNSSAGHETIPGMASLSIDSERDELTKLKCQLRRLSEERVEVSKHLRQLDESITAISQRARSLEASCALIRYLPDEILLQIFRLAQWDEFPWGTVNPPTLNPKDYASRAFQPWSLSQVCQRWRNIALGCTALWSRIILFMCSGHAGERHLLRAREQLKRSGEQLLDMEMFAVESFTRLAEIAGEGEPCGLAKVDASSLHESRWRSIRTNQCLGILQKVTTVLQRSNAQDWSPNLRRLEIHMFPETPDSTSPLLPSSGLVDLRVAFGNRWGMDLSPAFHPLASQGLAGVTTFHCILQPSSDFKLDNRRGLAHLLAAMPQLEAVVIAIRRRPTARQAPDRSDPQEDLPAISLSRLQKLYLSLPDLYIPVPEFRGPSDRSTRALDLLLHQLAVPALTTLAIDGQIGSSTYKALSQLIDQSKCTITSLTLDMIIHGRDEEIGPILLNDFLKSSMSDLETLEIGMQALAFRRQVIETLAEQLGQTMMRPRTLPKLRHLRLRDPGEALNSSALYDALSMRAVADSIHFVQLRQFTVDFTHVPQEKVRRTLDRVRGALEGLAGERPGLTVEFFYGVGTKLSSVSSVLTRAM